MTICIATDGYFPKSGGISTFYNFLSQLFTVQGHKVIVLTISENQEDSDKEDEILLIDSITKVILKKTFFQKLFYYQQFFRPGGYAAYQWIAMGTAMREWLIKNTKTYEIDIIEVTDYGGIGFFLSDNNLPPVTITAHGSLLQYANFNFTGNGEQVQLIKHLEQLSFDNADGIIAHSILNQEDLKNITTNRVFFATAPWTFAENKTASFTDNDYLLVIGGMQIVKGAITMAQALNLCVKERPDCKLYWIGPDFYVAPQVELMSVYLQKNFPNIWNHNFIWLNEQPRSATQKQLRQAKLVVIPSDWETFSYIALEAAAAGKPIIISDKAGAAYLFNHNENAWIVPANNPKALADAILYLSEQKDLCAELGRNAKKRIEEVFVAEKVVSERMAIYTHCIKNRNHLTINYEEKIRFINKYTTIYRKKYYKARALAKRILLRK